MKYYINQRLCLREIGRDEYYKLRRRKDCIQETVMFNGGIKTGRYIKIGRYLTFRD